MSELDHAVVGRSRPPSSISRVGGRGDGMSVYFRDPDGSLLELISY